MPLFVPARAVSTTFNPAATVGTLLEGTTVQVALGELEDLHLDLAGAVASLAQRVGTLEDTVFP